MRHDLRWLLGMSFLCVILAVFTAPTHAQGYYVAVIGNDDEGVGNLETDLSGFVGGDECADVTTLWSELNGTYLYGGLGLDNLIQTVMANPGVSYVWNWGFTYQFADPYTGLCDNYSESFSDVLETHITYYHGPSLVLGYCYYSSIDCSSGVPYCPGSPPYGCTAGYNTPFGGICSQWMEATWVAVAGKCASCWGSSADSSGACN
jgi:hypothetical protein